MTYRNWMPTDRRVRPLSHWPQESGPGPKDNDDEEALSPDRDRHWSEVTRPRMLRLCVAGVAAIAVAGFSSHPRAAAFNRSPTAAQYARAVTQICAGALLFNGAHTIGTRDGAVAVSNDIALTGGTRLHRIEALPKPSQARTVVRWLSVEHQLVTMYATNYLRIWTAIEQARSPRQRAQLAHVLLPLIHQSDALVHQAVTLEHALGVPDCTGGVPPSTSGIKPPEAEAPQA